MWEKIHLSEKGNSEKNAVNITWAIHRILKDYCKIHICNVKIKVIISTFIIFRCGWSGHINMVTSVCVCVTAPFTASSLFQSLLAFFKADHSL